MHLEDLKTQLRVNIDVRTDTLNLHKIPALIKVNVVRQTPLFLVRDMPSNSGANLGVVQIRG
jgi:hypothetical protein